MLSPAWLPARCIPCHEATTLTKKPFIFFFVRPSCLRVFVVAFHGRGVDRMLPNRATHVHPDILKRHGIHADRLHLVQRHTRSLAGGQGSRARARSSLRHGRGRRRAGNTSTRREPSTRRSAAASTKRFC